MAVTVGEIQAILRLKDLNFSRGLKQAQGQVTSFRKVGVAGMRVVGRSIAVLGSAMIAFGVAALGMSIKFNKSMANVATLIPGNIGRVNELKTAVQGLAIAHGKDTADLAEGLYQTISAFGDEAGKTIKILEINSKAAAAGLSTTTEAINLTASITKAYGDTSARAVQQVADLALMTVRLGQTDFPALARSMGKVTPIAQAMGQSQEELFAVFATATGVVGTASEVSTQYRGVLAALLNPTTQMTDLIEKSGFASGKAMLAQQGLVGTLQDVVAAAEESGRPITDYIAMIEAVPLALALAGPQADTFRSKLKELGDAAGTVEEAFAEQSEGVNKLGFMWEQLKTQGTVLLQLIGDHLTPIMITLLSNFQAFLDDRGGVQGLADAFSNMLPRAIQFLVDATIVLSRAFRAIQIIALSTVDVIVVAFQSMVGAIAEILIPLLKIQQGMAAATMDMGKLAQATMNLETIQNLATSSWDQAAERLLNMDDRVTALLADQAALEVAIGNVGAALAASATPLTEHAKKLLAKQEALLAMKDAANQLSDKIAKKLNPSVSQAGFDIEALAAAAGPGLVPNLSEARAALARFGITIPNVALDMEQLRFVLGNTNISVQQQRDAVAQLWAQYEAGGHLTPELVAQLKELANALDDASEKTGFFGSIFGGLKDSFKGVMEGLTGGKGLTGFFSNLGSGIVEGLGQAVAGGITSMINMGVSLAIEGLKKLGGIVFGKIREIFGGPSAAEIAGRQVAADFATSMGLLLDATLLAERAQLVAAGGTESWANKVLGLKNAFLALGKSEAEALAIVNKLGAAEKKGADAVAAVIAGVQGDLDKVKAAMSSTGLTLTELRDKVAETAKLMGISIAQAFDLVAKGAEDTLEKLSAAVFAAVGKIGMGVTAALAAGIETAAQVKLAASGVAAAFRVMAADGRPMTEIIATIGSAAKDLVVKFRDLGIEPPAALKKLNQLANLVANEGIANAIDQVSALGNVFSGLSDLGLATQSDLGNFAASVKQAFDDVVAGGGSAKQAIALIGPELQLILDAQANFGFEVDKGTQALLDQALAQGVVKVAALDTTDAITQGFNGLFERFDAFLKAQGIATDGFMTFGDTAEVGMDAANKAVKDGGDQMVLDVAESVAAQKLEWAEMQKAQAVAMLDVEDNTAKAMDFVEITISDSMSEAESSVVKLRKTWSNEFGLMLTAAKELSKELVGKSVWPEMIDEMNFHTERAENKFSDFTQGASADLRRVLAELAKGGLTEERRGFLDRRIDILQAGGGGGGGTGGPDSEADRRRHHHGNDVTVCLKTELDGREVAEVVIPHFQDILERSGLRCN